MQRRIRRKKYSGLFTLILGASLLTAGCSGKPVPHEEDEASHGHEHGIELQEEMIREFGIEEEKVEEGPFHHVIKVGGKIESSASDIHTITAKKSGIVTLASDILAGANVKNGQRIGSISVEGVQGGDLNRAAISNLESARAEYERLKPLYSDGLVTASAFREAERAYKEAEALAGKSSGGSAILTAPASGNIRNLYVTSGEYVEVGAPIAVISKNTELTLRADLPAREASHLGELASANFIPEGSREVVKLSELNGKKLTGNAGVSNGYIPVYFSFSGDPLAFAGGYAEVFLLCGNRQGVITVPRDALVEIQGNKYVYVSEHGHAFEKRLVETGSGDGERVEILSGLEPGETFVSKGASVVRMAEISAVAPPSHSHNH